MSNLNEELKAETEKWLKKAKEKRQKIKLLDKSKNDMIKNIDAYISDSQHFMDKGDLIRSFEAIIWSWAILELGLELGILDSISTK